MNRDDFFLVGNESLLPGKGRVLFLFFFVLVRKRVWIVRNKIVIAWEIFVLVGQNSRTEWIFSGVSGQGDRQNLAGTLEKRIELFYNYLRLK